MVLPPVSSNRKAGFEVSPARGAVILILPAEKVLSMLSTTVMKREAPLRDWTYPSEKYHLQVRKCYSQQRTWNVFRVRPEKLLFRAIIFVCKMQKRLGCIPRLESFSLSLLCLNNVSLSIYLTDNSWWEHWCLLTLVVQGRHLQPSSKCLLLPIDWKRSQEWQAQMMRQKLGSKSQFWAQMAHDGH